MDTCPNCGAELTGKFCSNCGQKKIERHDYAFSHFLGHAVNEFTHFDSRFFRSFKTLIIKPGQLTEDFIIGRRSLYMQPLQLFIITNVIFFFITHYLGNLNLFVTPLRMHVSSGFYSRYANELVHKHLLKTTESYAHYEERFNHNMKGQAKSLIIIMAPMFALLLFAIYRKAHKFYVQHLVFSIHFFTYLLIAFMTIIPAIFITFESLFYPKYAGQEDQIFVVTIGLLGFLFLFFAARRVYKEDVYSTFIKSALLIYSMGWIFTLYRFLLFVVVYYTT